MHRTINHKKARTILRYQSAGFVLIILLSWLDEVLSLPHVFFGGPSSSNWREAAMESVLIVGVWIMVFTLTRKLLARLYYLEGFIKVCSWCRKIHHGEHWIPLEEYFSKGFDTETSHSICPGCAKKMESDAFFSAPTARANLNFATGESQAKVELEQVGQRQTRVLLPPKKQPVQP